MGTISIPHSLQVGAPSCALLGLVATAAAGGEASAETITGTYDTHEYFEEKREALEAWALRVAAIVEPKPDNVIELLRARQ